MTGYILSPAARQDLLEIADYITADSPAAAERLQDKLFDGFDALAAHPGIGHTRSDLTAQAVRFFPIVGRYWIVYRESAAGIEVVRVLGPGRDAASLLR